MSNFDGSGGGTVPMEVFAAKDSPLAVFLAVPRHCGLKEADTLRIDGVTVLAMRSRSILPIDFPELTQQSADRLAALAHGGQQLAVGEFGALGLFDSYFLTVVTG
jgi:hypothetical protein